MSVLSEHIKSLRKQQGLTQEQLAAELGIKRSLLAAYEEGRAEPRLQNLLTISVFFGKSIDELLGRSSSASTPKGSVGNSPKVLAITVDRQERENIELVPQKASAGYLNGFQILSISKTCLSFSCLCYKMALSEPLRSKETLCCRFVLGLL